MLLMLWACTQTVATPSPTPTPAATPGDCAALDEAACEASPDCWPQQGFSCTSEQWTFIGCFPSESNCIDTGITCLRDGDADDAFRTSSGCYRPSGELCPEGYDHSPGVVACTPG